LIIAGDAALLVAKGMVLFRWNTPEVVAPKCGIGVGSGSGIGPMLYLW
jgi:hypothetical protein